MFRRLGAITVILTATAGVGACGGSSSSSGSAGSTGSGYGNSGSSSAAAAPGSSSGSAAAGPYSHTSTSSGSSGGSSSASGGSSASSSTSSGSPSGGGSLAVAADPSGALKFTSSTLHAAAGKVTISFTNKASFGHNFTLADSSGKVLGATPTFSGATKTLTVTLKPGTYTFYCSVPGHRQGGMQGTLTVP